MSDEMLQDAAMCDACLRPDVHERWEHEASCPHWRPQPYYPKTTVTITLECDLEDEKQLELLEKDLDKRLEDDVLYLTDEYATPFTACVCSIVTRKE